MKLFLAATLCLLTFFTQAEERKYEPSIQTIVLALPATGVSVTLSPPDKMKLKIPQKPPKESTLKAAEITEIMALATSISKTVKPGPYSHSMKEGYSLYLQPDNGLSSFEYSLQPGTENPMPEALAQLFKKVLRYIK